MNRIVLFAALGIARFATASAEVTSAELKRCPDGHATVKDVPISYGLSALSHEEIMRHVENFDFVLGGCEVMADSPRVQPTCTTCRLGYDSASRIWSRSSPEMRSFKRSFSSRLVSFPRLPQPRSIDYVQRLRDGRVISEEVWYTAGQDHPELKSYINQWLRRQGINAEYTEPKEGRTVREWKGPGISIRFSYEPGELFVWLTHQRQAR